MIITKTDIALYLNPGGRYFSIGDTLTSPDGDPVPTDAEIEAARPAAALAAAAAAAAAAVPVEVSMAQFRLALLWAGIDPNTIAQSLAGDPAALIRWEYSGTVRRAHPLVAGMAEQLKKSPAEVDDIFRYAETL